MRATKRKLSSCGSCNRLDNNKMVQCDDCDSWYHYLCVGVGSEVSNLDWSCLSCRSKKISDTLEQYQLADSISRNLNPKKQRLVSRATTRKSQNKLTVEEANKSTFTKEEVEEMIRTSVRDALAKQFEEICKSYPDCGMSEWNAQNGIKASGTEANAIEANELAIISPMGEPEAMENFNDQTNDFTFYHQNFSKKEALTLSTTMTIVSNHITDAVVANEPNTTETTTNEMTSNEPITNKVSTNEANRSEANGIEAKGIDANGIEANGIELAILFPIGEPDAMEKFNFNDLTNDFTFYHEKFSKKGALKLSTTMTIVSNQIIKDSLMKKYSYMGRQKLNFRVYKNVEKLIVTATMDAYNRYNGDSQDFVPVTKEKVEMHYRTLHIKYADQRDKRNQK